MVISDSYMGFFCDLKLSEKENHIWSKTPPTFLLCHYSPHHYHPLHTKVHLAYFSLSFSFFPCRLSRILPHLTCEAQPAAFLVVFFSLTPVKCYCGKHCPQLCKFSKSRSQRCSLLCFTYGLLWLRSIIVQQQSYRQILWNQHQALIHETHCFR